MARDAGLEEMVGDLVSGEPGLTKGPMFGGWAWLLDGNLLCGARTDGVLLRLGKGNDGWALEAEGVTPMIMQGRPMSGWIRVSPDAFSDENFARRLMAAALSFVRSLPPKDAGRR
jgi:hypothetical protein